jgi:hypothetical protein
LFNEPYVDLSQQHLQQVRLPGLHDVGSQEDIVV